MQTPLRVEEPVKYDVEQEQLHNALLATAPVMVSTADVARHRLYVEAAVNQMDTSSASRRRNHGFTVQIMVDFQEPRRVFQSIQIPDFGEATLKACSNFNTACAPIGHARTRHQTIIHLENSTRDARSAARFWALYARMGESTMHMTKMWSHARSEIVFGFQDAAFDSAWDAIGCKKAELTKYIEICHYYNLTRCEATFRLLNKIIRFLEDGDTAPALVERAFQLEPKILRKLVVSDSARQQIVYNERNALGKQVGFKEMIKRFLGSSVILRNFVIEAAVNDRVWRTVSPLVAVIKTGYMVYLDSTIVID